MRTPSHSGRTAAIGIVIALLAAVVSVRGGQAGMPRATPESVGMSAQALQQATALLRQYVTERRISGAVAAVARRGKVVYLEPVGLQNLEAKTPMAEGTLFRVYSMTKAVTAVGVMMLVDEGKLRLSDAVATYLPEFANVVVAEGGTGAPRPPARAITIQDLLLHTSGLSHRTSDLYRARRVRSRAIGLPQFITNITSAPLLEDPGTRFRYSEGTTVLGRVIEVVSGVSFDRFVTVRVLRPLRMNDTAFWVEGAASGRLATVYRRAADGTLSPFEIEEVPFTQKPALMEGAVGLVSTAGDFLRFGQLLLDGGALDGVRLLSTATTAAITKNALPDEILRARGGATGWGLANVDVVVGPGSRGYLTTVGEFGWDGSAGTFFAVDPSRELVITLMTQNLPADPDGLRQKFKAAVVESILN